MSKTHWRKIINTAYLGGHDLADDKGKFNEIAVTIKSAGPETVKDQNGKDETCLVVRFRENIKPMILNVTNSKMIEKHAGSGFMEDWAGLRIQIGTEKIRAFGEVYDALRVRKYPPRTNTAPPEPIVACEDCGNTIKGTGKTSAEQVIAGTEKTYGAKLCLECATKRQEERLQAETEVVELAESEGAK